MLRPLAGGLRRFGAGLAAALLLQPATAQLPGLVEEVPFITTPDHVTLAMLEIAGVGPADHVIDLGSGDGRIVITAARRFGASGLGVEIVPELVERSRASAVQAGVAARTRFAVQDLFETDLAPASVVTMYLLPEFNLRLRPLLLALQPGTRVVSHDWDMGDWLPDRTLTLPVPDKVVGREKISRVHLWRVPAPVDGRWCSAAGELRISQHYQRVQARLDDGRQRLQLIGRVEGRELSLAGDGGSTLQLSWQGGTLQAGAATGAAGAWRGQRLSRAGAPGTDATNAADAACPLPHSPHSPHS